MFCESCGSRCDDAKFCHGCGASLQTAPGAKAKSRREASSKTPKLLVSIVVVVVAIVLVGLVTDSEKPTGPSSQADAPARRLPVSVPAVLGSYNARPTLTGATPGKDGNQWEWYSSDCHQIGFESHRGVLVGYALTFQRFTVETDNRCALIMALRSGLFVNVAAGADLKDAPSIIEELGNTWSPGPNRVVINGVELTRFFEHGRLFYYARME